MTSPESKTNRLSAFVGRSFLDVDKQVWLEIREMLESMRPVGFVFEDAKEAQPKPVSEKVRDGIQRNDIYIAILTRRHLICSEIKAGFSLARLFGSAKSKSRWTASEWIVEEIGYAIGLKKYVLLMLEEGVLFPTTDLDGDMEWISFQRGSVNACQSRLTQIISHLVNVRMPLPLETAPPGESTSPSVIEVAEEHQPTFFAQVEEIAELSISDPKEADVKEADLLSNFEGDEIYEEIRNLILRKRAIAGDRSALSMLLSRADSDIESFSAASHLSQFYKYFGQIEKAIECVLNVVDRMPEQKQWDALMRLAGLYMGKKEWRKAQESLVRAWKLSGAAPRKVAVMQLVADIAKEQGDFELELAMLEAALDVDPINSTLRFRLGYAYSASRRDKLSVLHYRIYVAQTGDPVGWNNLGISYASLKLNGREIMAYDQAEEKNSLARANLACVYLERGFLIKAEELANQVLSSDSNEGKERAAYAIGKVKEVRDEEEGTVSKIAEETSAERAFMLGYAASFFCDQPVFTSATFTGHYGKLNLVVTDGKLSATAESRTRAGGLMALAALGGITGGNGVQFVVRQDSIQASLQGRTARGKLESRTRIDSESEGAARVVTRNIFMAMSEDLSSIEVMEVEDSKASIYKLQRVA